MRRNIGTFVMVFVGLAAAGGLFGLGLTAAGAQTRAIGAPGAVSLDAGMTPFVQAAQRGEVSPPSVEDVEHMCALLTSCDKLPLPPSLIPEDMASCVRKMSEELTAANAVKFSLTMRECGLMANSCSELRACALRGARPDVCAGRGKSAAAGYCDHDGRAVTCWKERVLAVRDCPRGGEQCAVREGQALCTLGPCTGENKEGAAPTCSASGTRILQCELGKLVSLDCAAFGLRCMQGGPNNSPGCAPTTAACTPNSKRCEGNVSVGCVHGHEVRVDCAAAGLVCNGTPGSTTIGACSAPKPEGPSCDPGEKSKCDGANVKYCYAGKPRSFFCKGLGFNRCVADGKGARCAL